MVMTDVSREKTCFFCGFRQKTVLTQSKSNTTLLSGYIHLAKSIITFFKHKTKTTSAAESPYLISPIDSTCTIRIKIDFSFFLAP